MKKKLALILSAVMLLSACAGNVTTKDDVKPADSSTTTTQQSSSSSSSTTTTTTSTTTAKPTVSVLAQSSQEKIATIIRDQLAKNGFDVTVDLQPDYSSYKAKIDAANYDIAVSGWTTVTGNPDYAVRSLFKTGGDYNNSPIEDSVVDNFIDKAATETAAEYVQTYKEFEDYLVAEKGYIVPLYRGIKTQGINIEVLDADSVRISQARAMAYETITFNDTSKNATEPLILAQASSDLTSLDPIKGNDGSINQLNSNMYVRLVNLTDDDQVVPDGSLSYEFSIGEGNADYYFVLRDDINFAKVENMQAVNTGVRVGGEDVVFSLSRAYNKDSVPNHKTYSLHESMKEIVVVADISELQSTASSTGKTVFDELQESVPTAIESLTTDKTQANNAAGVYQVVKVTTHNPFPQVLNYLAHQSAGILSKEQVESINTYDIATYDVTKDLAYGDQTAVMEGPTYANHLWCSGPYIMTVKNDYEARFLKNPGYMVGTEYEPKINNITMRFIADTDSTLAALRAGEIHVQYSVPEAKIDLVTGDSKLLLKECPSNAINYLIFNQKGQFANEDLRKAVLYSINQDEIVAVFANRVFRAYSTLSPFVNTGNVLYADPAKVSEHLANWAAAK